MGCLFWIAENRQVPLQASGASLTLLTKVEIGRAVERSAEVRCYLYMMLVYLQNIRRILELYKTSIMDWQF